MKRDGRGMRKSICRILGFPHASRFVTRATFIHWLDTVISVAYKI